MRKILSGTVMMLVMASSTSVEAAPAYSWNLSRDMMSGITTNPFGVGNVWTAMYDTVGTSHIATNYLAMPTYDPSYAGYTFEAWKNTAINSLVIGTATQTYNFTNGLSNFSNTKGVPTLHPGSTHSDVIRWKSPINGNVNIMGRISDADSACGNGIKWFVDKGNFTLMSGVLANGNNGKIILQQNIPVSVGTYLYFIVSPNNDNLCDTTYLDIIITSP